MTKGLLTVPMCDISRILSIKDRMNYEEELILPDYFPDIERVVFLKSRSAVSSVSFAENEISVSGLTFLNLCCESEDKKLQSTEFSIPFRKIFPMKEALCEPLGFCRAQSDSISYKLISKRRLDVRGAFSLDGEVIELKEEKIVEKSEDPHIITDEEKVKYLVPYDCINEIISSSEEFLLPENKPLPGEILDAEVTVSPEKCFFKDGSLIFKGSVFLHALYTPQEDGGSIESFDTVFPISKEWDGLELEEGFIIKPVTEPLSISLTKSQEVIKEDGELLFEGEISCKMIVLAPSERLLARDGFSTSCEYEKEEAVLSILKSEKDFIEEAEAAGEIPAPSDMRETVAFSSYIQNISIENENGKTAFCDVRFDVIFKNAENKLSSLGHTLRCSIPLFKEEDKQLIFAFGNTKGVNTSLYNGKLRLFSKISVYGFCLKAEDESFLKDIKLFEDRKLSKNSDYSMIIYYADKDDKLWDIGRKYKVDPKRIKEENSLKEDFFKERTPLIIPL